MMDQEKLQKVRVFAYAAGAVIFVLAVAWKFILR
jgi:hypothetical protein